MDHARAVLVTALVMTALSAWAFSRLDIVTDLRRLLPDHFPSVVRLDRLEQRAGNQSDIVVSVSSSDPDGNLRWAGRFAELMEREESIRFVQFRRALADFEGRALLYLSLAELEEIRRDVRREIRVRVRDSMDFDLDDDDFDGPPPGEQFDLPEGPTARMLDDFEAGEDFFAPEEEAGEDFVRGPTARMLDDFEAGEDFEDYEPHAARPRDEGDAPGEDLLGIEEFKERYGIEELSEYYQNEDGTLVVVRARPHAGTSDTRVARELVLMTRANIEAAHAPDDPPDLEIELKGHHLERTQEVQSLRGNMAISATVCMVLLFTLLGLYFKRKRAVLLIATPLVMSVLWALGLAYLLYGFLNIISAFIFAVLLGLGIDFGIHVLARYGERRRDGDDNRAAMCVALETSGLSAVTGGVTTAAVFFLLTIGDFQGFSQFGLVAGCGVFGSLLAVFTVMPALATLFERRRPWRPRTVNKSAPGVARAGWVNKRFAATLTVVVVGLSTLGAVHSFLHLNDIEFEYAFNKLGSRSKLRAEEEAEERREQLRLEAEARGEEEWYDEDDTEAYKDVIGQHAMGAPTIIMTRDLAETEEIQRQLERLGELHPAAVAALAAAERPEELRQRELLAALEALPASHPERLAIERDLDHMEGLLERYSLERLKIMAARYNTVESIFRFIPSEQEEKLPLIADIRRRLVQKIEVFEGEDRERVDELLPYLEPEPVTVADLPEWLREQFREPTGEEGRFLVLFTRGSKTDIQTTGELKKAFFTLSAERGEVEAAANYFVLPEIMATITKEGPLIIGLALLGLLVILFSFFRSLLAVAMVLTPLCMAVLWVGGILAVSGMKLNFYNVVVIPLLLGMGVDHGVHIYSRYVEQGRKRIATVIRETGVAVGMATLTTIIGFSGMFFADHVGLQTMAQLAIIGLSTTFLGAVVTLPALLYVDQTHRETQHRAR